MGQPKLSTEEIILCQRAIGEMAQLSISADGAFGPLSSKALATLQKQMNLPVTGVLDDDSYATLKAFIDMRYVRMTDIAKAAVAVGILPSMLLAIAEKESTNAGFLSDGRPTILFERHKFFEFVKARISYQQASAWSEQYPNLCWPSWTQGAYKGGRGEWDRLASARMLDATCALMSCSWGRFQIMGFNFNICGYSDVQTFVDDMHKNEQMHLKAAVNYIVNQSSLYAAARSRNFEGVARVYNGIGYKKNKYDTQLMELEKKLRSYNTITA